MSVPHISNIRRVWRVITINPHASVRELARAADVAPSTVQHSLTALDALGYIERTPGVARARRVVVPFAEVRL